MRARPPQPGPCAPRNAEAQTEVEKEGCPARSGCQLGALGRREPQPPRKDEQRCRPLPGRSKPPLPPQGSGGRGGHPARLSPSFPGRRLRAVRAGPGRRGRRMGTHRLPVGPERAQGRPKVRSGLSARPVRPDGEEDAEERPGRGALGVGAPFGGVSTITPVCGEGCERDPGLLCAPPGSARGKDILGPPMSVGALGVIRGRGTHWGVSLPPSCPGLCVAVGVTWGSLRPRTASVGLWGTPEPALRWRGASPAQPASPARLVSVVGGTSSSQGRSHAQGRPLPSLPGAGARRPARSRRCRRRSWGLGSGRWGCKLRALHASLGAWKPQTAKLGSPGARPSPGPPPALRPSAPRPQPQPPARAALTFPGSSGPAGEDLIRRLADPQERPLSPAAEPGAQTERGLLPPPPPAGSGPSRTLPERPERARRPPPLPPPAGAPRTPGSPGCPDCGRCGARGPGPGQDAHGRLGSRLSGSAFAPPGPPPTPRPLLPPAPAAPSPVAAAAPLLSPAPLFSPFFPFLGGGGSEPGAGRRGQEEEEAEDRAKEEERGRPLPHPLPRSPIPRSLKLDP